jgi:hypothetical protein
MKRSDVEGSEQAPSRAARSLGWFSRTGLLGTVILAVACSTASASGATTNKVTRSFAHRVDSACTANLTKFPQVGHFPYDNFDPRHPAASQLPGVGAYFTQGQRGIQPLENALTRLGEPSEGRAAWDQVKSLAFAILDNARAQRTAALAGSVHRFVVTVDKGNRLVNRLKIAATQAGLSVNGACSKIFQ